MSKYASFEPQKPAESDCKKIVLIKLPLKLIPVSLKSFFEEIYLYRFFTHEWDSYRRALSVNFFPDPSGELIKKSKLVISEALIFEPSPSE